MTGQVRSVKLAFVGATCVGKTTLLHELHKQIGDGSGVTYVEEAAREFFLNHEVADKFSAETQGKIQSRALEREYNAHGSGSRLIFCDRSVLDAAVYVMVNGDRKGADQLLERVRFWLPTYDKFLLLSPAGIPYQGDSIREENARRRQQCHRAFIAFFRDTGIDFELLSGSIGDRLSRVNQIIRSYNEC